MAVDLNKGYVTKSSLIVTPKGRLFYPSLFNKTLPKGEKNPDKAKYVAKLLLPKTADISLLTAMAVDAVVKAFGAGPYKFKIKNWGLQKTEDVAGVAEYAEEYPFLVTAKADQKPATVFANMKPCNSEEEVYGGRWAQLSLDAYGNTEFKTVSFGLKHVMLLDNDEPMGGGRVRVEDAFEAVDAEADGKSADSLFG